nr:MAG TPA: hypothetical protein [Caudoviricetes sp.]
MIEPVFKYFPCPFLQGLHNLRILEKLWNSRSCHATDRQAGLSFTFHEMATISKSSWYLELIPSFNGDKKSAAILPCLIRFDIFKRSKDMEHSAIINTFYPCPLLDVRRPDGIDIADFLDARKAPGGSGTSSRRPCRLLCHLRVDLLQGIQDGIQPFGFHFKVHCHSSLHVMFMQRDGKNPHVGEALVYNTRFFIYLQNFPFRRAFSKIVFFDVNNKKLAMDIFKPVVSVIDEEFLLLLRALKDTGVGLPVDFMRIRKFGEIQKDVTVRFHLFLKGSHFPTAPSMSGAGIPAGFSSCFFLEDFFASFSFTVCSSDSSAASPTPSGGSSSASLRKGDFMSRFASSSSSSTTSPFEIISPPTEMHPFSTSTNIGASYQPLALITAQSLTHSGARMQREYMARATVWSSLLPM